MSETAAATRARRRVRAHIAGTVQGVGFRPFVYRVASELGLGGWVFNDGRGVVLEVEGAPDAVEALLIRLRAEAPPLAAIEEVRVEPAAPTGERDFRILESERGGPPEALVSPDFATCAECLAEESSTPPIGGTATRSPTAPTAGRAFRSSPGSPTTGR